MFNKKWVSLAWLILIGLVAWSGCSGKPKEVEVTKLVKETVVETIVERETVIVTAKATEPPLLEEEEERTLIVCIGQEPDTLYIYDGSILSDRHVQHAIYDGPIDNRSFDHQPIILEKLPNLADGDAVIRTVTVEAGDLVMDNVGEPVILAEGTRVRPAGCYAPECAVAFDEAPLEMEQMVVTFKWKEGIVWSDGEPLTAHDSVYSFQLYMDPDTPISSRFVGERTASYEATDDHTSIWIGLPGYRDTTYFANIWHPLPEHVWGDLTAMELLEAEESSRLPIGWGPYVIQEWVAGDHLTLSKNELYWRANEGLPKFDWVIFRIVGQNSNANVAALLAGECDIVDQNGQLEQYGELLLELETLGQLDVSFVTTPSWEHVVFGINPVESYDRPNFFQDVRVRRAIAHCMDRQTVIDTVLYGHPQVIDTYVPSTHPLFNPDVVHYDFDVERGSALLEEAGWIDDDGDPATPRVAQGIEGVPDGTPLEFNYWTTNAAQRVAVAQILQASMARCGIKANLEYWDATDYFVTGPEGPLLGRHFDMGQFMLRTGAQPPCQFYLSSQIPGEDNGWVGQNAPGFIDEEFDLACNAARQSLPGMPEYRQYHREAQRIFGEQVPAVPLYLPLKVAATRPDFKNFIMDPTESSEMWNIEAFDF